GRLDRRLGGGAFLNRRLHRALDRFGGLDDLGGRGLHRSELLRRGLDRSLNGLGGRGLHWGLNGLGSRSLSRGLNGNRGLVLSRHDAGKRRQASKRHDVAHLSTSSRATRGHTTRT